MKFFDRLTTQQRWLLGIGLPFVGGFMPWVLLPRYDLTQDFYRWTHPELLLYPSLCLSLGSMIVLAFLGAFFIARMRALLVVPLAVLVGYLIGVKLFFLMQGFVFRYPIEYLSPVLLEAFIGAALGLAIVKSLPFVQRAWANRPRHSQGRFAQDILPPDGRLVAVTRAAEPAAPPATRVAPPQPSSVQPEAIKPEPVEPEQAEPEPDEIAAIVAQMQQAYADAQSQEQAAGQEPAPTNAAEAVVLLSPEEQRLLEQYRQQRQHQQQEHQNPGYKYHRNRKGR